MRGDSPSRTPAEGSTNNAPADEPVPPEGALGGMPSGVLIADPVHILDIRLAKAHGSRSKAMLRHAVNPVGLVVVWADPMRA